MTPRVYKLDGFWFARVYAAEFNRIKVRIFQTWAEAIDWALYPWA